MLLKNIEEVVSIMKDVKIEQAAIEHSEAMSVSLNPSETIALRDGFIVGAKWRISSAWHKSNEEPISHFKLMLYEDNNGEFELGYTFDPARIKRWALVEDLLPENKEETK